jgi:hypothetical protein
MTDLPTRNPSSRGEGYYNLDRMHKDQMLRSVAKWPKQKTLVLKSLVLYVL